MVISALTQMLREVEWGTLDVMVVDMPPGTGDAQLTMAQQVPLKGAVIVSTPQDLALIDARRGIAMFRRVNVPVLGIIENMSYFLCPHCGARSDIFSHGGARHEAERLDVMVVDMPPGTGDAQLTMAQLVPLKGAVIVSTPQDLALIDARRGIAMFRRVNVPVLGIVENMSYFLCPQCGTRSDIFGHGGARHEAERLGVPFLGEVPLHIDIREKSDAGEPPVATAPEGELAAIYRDIAAKVAGALKGPSRPPPKIIIEA